MTRKTVAAGNASRWRFAPAQATRLLASSTVLLAASAGFDRAAAQVIYDPTGGFLTLPPFQSPTGQPQTGPLGTTNTLPLFPITGLGFAGAPATYTGVIHPASPSQAPGAQPEPGAPNTVPGQPLQNALLPPIQVGAAPIQTGDNRAPWLLALPSVALAEGFDDNPRQTPNRLADSRTDLIGDLIGSIDTPHLQAYVAGSADFLKFARATDQDQITVNGAGYALATLAPEQLFVDARAAMFQVSPTGGLGFTNPALVTAVQPTSLLTTSVTPILREKLSDDIEADLRYNHSNLTPSSPLLSGGTTANTLTAADENQGSLTVAFGRGSETWSSRVSLGALGIDSNSFAQSNQVRGVGDVQYRINPEVALIARGGYENLRYPIAGLAFTGPIATAGARLDLAPGSSFILRYGREDGGWGFEGGLSQALGPRTTLLAAFRHGITSQQEQILNNLNASRLDPYGTITDAQTGLPLALADTEFNFSQTGVFRTQQAQAAVTHEFTLDSVRFFAFYDKETSLVAGVASDTARGAQLAYFRPITPRLTGAASVGYAMHVGDRTLTNGVSLIYNIRDRVDATLAYQFQDVFSSTPGSSYLRNILIAGIRASF